VYNFPYSHLSDIDVPKSTLHHAIVIHVSSPYFIIKSCFHGHIPSKFFHSIESSYIPTVPLYFVVFDVEQLTESHPFSHVQLRVNTHQLDVTVALAPFIHNLFNGGVIS
jgi:hypothetical protein